jgi:hypothetical protein
MGSTSIRSFCQHGFKLAPLVDDAVEAHHSGAM